MKTLCIAPLLLVLSGGLSAQSTFGTIVGGVRDPAGAAIPRAKIVITNEGTNVSKETATGESGGYEVTSLSPGPYTVTVEAAGFQRYVQRRINLETAQILRIDVEMSVGQLTETVNVESQAPLVESETGAVSDVRTGRQMRELPLNFVRGDAFGGGIFKFMSLSPGSFRYEGASSHSFGGSRSNQNSFVMDGVTMGDQGGGQITPMQPSFESVQEMKLNMVTASAEFSNVASVTVTTKSGTNELHGSAFWQYSTGSLNARNFFQTRVPFRVYNQFGGSLGGPVMLPGYNGRNRTFFFGAFEGNRDHTQTNFNSSVPTAALRQGNFSRVTNASGALIPILDPFNNNQPFAGNIIPASRISPVSLKVQERFYPLPNFGGADLLNQNLRATVTNAPYWNHFDARGDHRFSAANSMYGRFTWRNMPTPVPEGQLPNVGLRDQLRKIRQLSVVDTHVVSPTVVNEVRFGMARHENPRQGPLSGLPIVRDLGLRGLTNTQDIRAIPVFNITGFSSITQIDFNSGPLNLFYDFIENLTIIRNKHSIKLGFNFRTGQLQNQPIPNRVFGQYDFPGTFTGFSYADFLLGIPRTTSRSTPQERVDGTNQFYAGFIQDDFKVHRNVTLNLGLRYEWMNPYSEKTGRQFSFDPRTGNLVVPSEQGLRQVSPIFPRAITVVTAAQAGFPERGLRKGDGNNFDPRIGLAWRPFGHARSVVRAGWGVYRNQLSSSTFSSTSGGGPFTSDENFTNVFTGGRPLFQFPEPFLAAGTLGAQNVTGLAVNLFNAYTTQWNFTLEQEFAGTGFRTSYLGTRSTNLLYRRNLNQPPASTTPFNNNRRPFPQYNNITFVDNGGNSMYHALQVEAERKLTRGVYYQVGWTWAKQLSHGIDSGEQGATIADAFDRSSERGDDLYLSRHRMVASYIWELPFGPGRKWGANLNRVAALLAGGWRIAGVTLFQTGQRFTPTFAGRDPSNTNTIGGRPDRTGNGNLPKSQRTLDRWFDFTAFALPPVNAGRFGNSGIGVLEGPGTSNFDLGLFKYIPFRESGRVELSLSTTNTFNHPNFGLPAANLSAPNTVGRISSLQGQDESGPRTVILGLRIEF